MLNDFQKEVIESEKEVTIIAAASQQGGTTALLLKCLTHGHKLFIDGYNTVDNGNLINEFLKISEQYNPYEDVEVKKGGFGQGVVILWNKGCSSVTFINGGQADRLLFRKPNIDYVCVDNPEMLDKITIRQVNRLKNKKLFATNPFHCAWRNPEYVNGVAERDVETNIPVYKDYSWDKDYVDWNTVDKESKGYVVTKAYKHHYLPKVNVVHSDINCEYKGNLNWYSVQFLKGEWVL